VFDFESFSAFSLSLLKVRLPLHVLQILNSTFFFSLREKDDALKSALLPPSLDICFQLSIGLEKIFK